MSTLIFRMFEQVPTYAFLIVIIIGLKYSMQKVTADSIVFSTFTLRDERHGESLHVKRIGKQFPL
jgi:hypothetical protein